MNSKNEKNRRKRMSDAANVSKKTDNRGFTLVELLVAIAVLSLVVFPIAQVFVTATKSNSKARTELQATITANSVLESAKAFSIYVFDAQCNKVYTDSNANTFTLLAGTTTDSFVSSSYGGNVQTVTLDGTRIESIGKRAAGSAFPEKADTYAYAINGIKQSNNKYDAIVVLRAENYRPVDVGAGGSVEYTESNVQSVYSDYNKAYGVTVYVFKHKSSFDDYVGKDLASDGEILVSITGSKFDVAKKTK